MTPINEPLAESSNAHHKIAGNGVMFDRYRSEASLAVILIIAVIWLGALGYGVLKIAW